MDSGKLTLITPIPVSESSRSDSNQIHVNVEQDCRYSPKFRSMIGVRGFEAGFCGA